MHSILVNDCRASGAIRNEDTPGSPTVNRRLGHERNDNEVNEKTQRRLYVVEAACMDIGGVYDVRNRDCRKLGKIFGNW